MPTTTEQTALTTIETADGELQVAAQEAAVEAEIQAAMIVARRFPRDEDRAYALILKACGRPSFAADVQYSFPRGGSTIKGPSVYFAREFARVWGNIRHGVYVLHDDEETRTIRAWAWDLESNVKVEAEDSFQKLIFRKHGGWIKPDERDLRELTNRRAALAKRNCLLELLPPDMVDDAIRAADQTLANKVKEDPEAARKSIVKGFSGLNVPIDQLTAYLGHPIAQCSPAELVELRKVYQSIRDGNTSWAQHVGQRETGATEKVKDKLKPNGGAAKSAAPLDPEALEREDEALRQREAARSGGPSAESI